MTSHSLVELRDMLIAARQQREEVEADLEQAANEERKLRAELHKRSRSLFRLFYKKRIAALHDEVADIEDEIGRLEAWDETTHVDMTFETSDAAQRAYAALVRAFDALRSSAAVWDVTSDRDTNRIQERTTATRTVDRHPAKLDYASNDLVRFDGHGLMFENVNGEDILIYPGMALMPRADGMFALIDLRELRMTYRPTRFVENEQVPADAYVQGHTWAKVNKDGSPDRRFRDNYQIPICIYGQLAISSPSGVTEEYQISNVAAAEAFAAAVAQYQAALGR